MNAWLRVVALAVAFWGAGIAARPVGAAAGEEQKQALEWIDQFAERQALFHDADVERLRKRVAAMPAEEAAKWWNETAARRKMLDDPEWLDTEKWLREFLRVQAIYSDDQIREMQTKAYERSEVSARQLREVLDAIMQKRRELAQGSRQSEEIRREMVAARDAYRQENARERDAARRRAPASYPASPTPAVANREPRTRYNQPLVTSLDVARWSIMSGFFPRW